jgi:nicotinate-nucleotide--dimethylbenzimidazole phosphoribosyltransferase
MLLKPCSTKLQRTGLLAARRRRGRQLGELEPLAVRLGLMQNSLQAAVARAATAWCLPPTTAWPLTAWPTRRPAPHHRDGDADPRAGWRCPVFARQQGLNLSVVDCGVATRCRHMPAAAAQDRPRHPQCPRGQGHVLDQAHAAIRAGMEIADSLRGNVLACAGLGVGATKARPCAGAPDQQAPCAT